jgi:hypothetical protein
VHQFAREWSDLMDRAEYAWTASQQEKELLRSKALTFITSSLT